MTDKKQPPTVPERVWIDPEDSTFWNDTGDVKSLIPYARVHPVDDARVVELWDRVNAVKVQLADDGPITDQPTWADIHYLLSLLPQLSGGEPLKDSIPFTALLSVLKRLRSKNKNPNREWYEGWNAAIDCLIRDAEACLKTPTNTVSSSERRCGECGHADELDPRGRCMSVYYDAGGSLCYCGHKCVFFITERTQQ